MVDVAVCVNISLGVSLKIGVGVHIDIDVSVEVRVGVDVNVVVKVGVGVCLAERHAAERVQREIDQRQPERHDEDQVPPSQKCLRIHRGPPFDGRLRDHSFDRFRAL